MENCAFKFFFFLDNFLFLFCTIFPHNSFSVTHVHTMCIGSYAPVCTPHAAVLYERYLAPFSKLQLLLPIGT